MKFKSSNETWSRGISAVQNAVGSPISNPIVENIYITCRNDQVSFIATNLNLTIRCDGEAEIEEPGEIVVPSKLITNIARDLPNEEVRFEVENDSAKIQCGKFSAKMKGYSGELFPPFVTIKEGFEITLQCEILKDIIQKTIISTSQEKSRFELDGVKLDFTEDGFHAVSADGRRLSIVSLNDVALPKEPTSVFVPTKTMQEVNHSLPDEGEVTIRIMERKIQFKSGEVTIISNLLVENFPDYQKIIPPEGDLKIQLDREAFANAVKRTANLASKNTPIVLLKLKEKGIEIIGESEEIGGEGKDFLETNYPGEPFEIRLNFNYLNDVLRVIDEKQVELDIKNPKRPITIEGRDNKNFLYVLMPMRPPDQENEDENQPNERV